MKIVPFSTVVGFYFIAIAQAQTGSNNACPIVKENPQPLDTICGQTGTLPKSAQDYQVNGGLASSAQDCAQQCANVAACRFSAFTPPDPQCNGGDFGCGLGGCTGYSRTGRALGFKEGANADNTKYSARSCYYTPSSCDFIVQSDSGQFVVGSAGGPAVFAANEASATRLSHSASTGLYINQNGQKFVAAVPKGDRTTQTSIVSFVPQSQVGTTATPLVCYLIGGGTFYCSVQSQLNKFQFDACPRPNRPRRVLEVEYFGDAYGGPPGEGVCNGGERVTLKYLDYFGRR